MNFVIGGYFVIVLKAFVDDSGSGGDSRWYVLAGYVGADSDWIGFESEWREVLCADPRIEYFKSSEAESLKGEFFGVSVDQRNAKIDGLIEVIGRHARRAIHVRVRQKDYNEIIKENVPEIWDDAYYFLFPAFIAAVISMEKHYGTTQPVGFVFDSSQRLDTMAVELYKQLLELPQFKGRVADVWFRSEMDDLPLQAADLLAWQVRRYFCTPDEPRRIHFDRARDCPNDEPYSYALGRNDLKDVAAAMEVNARHYAARVGVPLEVVKEHVLKRRKRPKKRNK